MKNRYVLLFAIIMICLLGLPNTTYAQDLQIDDGAMLVLTGNNNSNIISSTMDNSSTALVVFDGNLSFTGALDNFYGLLKLGNTRSVNFAPTNSATYGKINLNDSYTGTTTLVKKNGTYGVLGSFGDYTVNIGDYGILDLTDDSNTGALTLANSLYFSTSGSHAGKISFKPSSHDNTQGTPVDAKHIEITSGNIYTGEQNGEIDLSQHVNIDLSGVNIGSLSSGTTYYFTLATGSSNFVVTGTPNISGNDGGLWTNISTYANVNGGHNFGLSARFSPVFASGGSYYSDFGTAISSVGPGSTLSLYSNYALSSPATVTGDIELNVGNATFSSTGGAAVAIASAKTLTLSGNSGQFSAPVQFSGFASSLKIVSNITLGSGFVISASSMGMGTIIIGDGTTTVSKTIDVSKFNSKVATVRIKSNSTLTLTNSEGRPSITNPKNTSKTQPVKQESTKAN